MTEAVVLLASIMGLILAVGAFLFHVLTRGDTNELDDEDEQARLDMLAANGITAGTPFDGVKSNAVKEIDSAADEAIEDITRTSKLVIEEINEKYQALLFLYNLLDEKKKDIDSLSVSAPKLEPVQKPLPSVSHAPRRRTTRPVGAGHTANDSQSAETGMSKSNPKYIKIKELQDQGLSVEDIARKLDMGQGEVKLFIELGGR